MDLVITKDTVDPNLQSDGTYKGARGGTELMLAELKRRLEPELFDKVQIICSRVVELDPNKQKVWWLHDLHSDPAVSQLSNPIFRNQFERLVFVSHQQFQQYNTFLGVPFHKSVVLRNAINPITPAEKSKEQVRLAYCTTPHRGLELLIPVFLHLADKDPNLHLDVASSFLVYGDAWAERNKPYEQLFEICAKHPQITYHGAATNDEVREILANAHIYAYPSTWQETSCIAAIEAMSARAVVVCPDYGALPETVGDYSYMYRWDEDSNVHANRFLEVLMYAIKNVREEHPVTMNMLDNARARSDFLFSWDRRIEEWRGFLRGL